MKTITHGLLQDQNFNTGSPKYEECYPHEFGIPFLYLVSFLLSRRLHSVVIFFFVFSDVGHCICPTISFTDRNTRHRRSAL
jgi:hypothetical protein